MISLKPYNTFRLNHYCDALHIIHNEKDLFDLIPFQSEPVIIGGGSNILLTRDLVKPVLLNEVRGKQIVKIGSESVVAKIGGGENWHDVVLWALDNDLGGIENLSYIPGKCGAAPIQNIGAYGVELDSMFERLDAIELSTGKKRIFEKVDCDFAYRDSIFKNELKDEYFILNIYLNLSLPGYHKKEVSYGQVQNSLEEKGILQPSIRDISETIVEIRKTKLPDPSEIPNCGSFFKNPIIDREFYAELTEKWQDIPCYEYSDASVKVPAGWLIERCGWKGKRIGDVGCHENHALVICNYGAKYGRKIVGFSKGIAESVHAEFGILLETEVNIL